MSVDATSRKLCRALTPTLAPVLVAADQQHSDDEHALPADAPQSTHCGTHRTSGWRRSADGAHLCNAWGMYVRLRGRDRPLSPGRK
ncbi:hypothetical protein B0H10DRAFT_2209509 [Mycena sp. CBHHK59/15]|nr:hypothetical protein B0H10DRAFT_2209509 [Mycena sp. CBHHK59/15]